MGRQAKCPKCGLLGQVERPKKAVAEPTTNDVKLDDLVEADPALAMPRKAAQILAPDSLALDAAARPQSFADHWRHFFSGSPPVNLLAGMLGGAHLSLVCLALSLLLFSVNGASGLVPHALVLTLLPAVLGSVILALNGRLAVAVGGPDPSSTVAVFLLLASLGADLSGRVPGPMLAATLLAALSLCGLLSGAFGVLLSRYGLADGVRFLPNEVLGGMMAGFGLLLVKAWGAVLVDSDPALAVLANLHFSDLGPALLNTASVWGPSVGFAVLYIIVHMSVRGIVWPLLLTALTVGAWNIFVLRAGALPGPLAGLAGANAHLPELLDMSCYLGLFDPQLIGLIQWPALYSRLEFLIAVVAMAILPSIVRTSILESVLARDADAEEQMRMVGASSMLSGLLGGLPSSLSLSSSLGLRALGATGPLAGFTAGLACFCFLLGGNSILAYIPKFVPLGMLLSTGLLMPVSWLMRDARNPFSRKDDLRAAWASCLFVALLGPVLGVFASLGLGLSLSLLRAVSGGGVRFLQTGDVYHSNVDRSPAERRILREQGGQILILRLQGFLFQGTLHGIVGTVRQRLAASPHPDLKFVLLDFGAGADLGSSAVIGFKQLEDLARAHGLQLLFTSVPLEMEERLERLGYRMGDEDALCHIALNLDYALEWCEDRILAATADVGTEQSRHQDTLEELLAATFPEPALVPTLMKCLERMEVPKKQYVIHQGEASDSMYFLQSGRVKVELVLPGGKMLRLKKMGPGTVFGEMGIYTSAPRSASVVATERCVVYRLSDERFKIIQSKAPQLAAAVNRFVVTLLADRVAEENAKARAMQL